MRRQAMKKGTVTMPLEEYDILMKKITLLDSAITVKKGWKGESIEVRCNFDMLREVVSEKIDNDFSDIQDYQIHDEFYGGSSTIATITDEARERRAENEEED